MSRRGPAIVALALLTGGQQIGAGMDRSGSGESAGELVITARVQHVYASRVFTVDNGRSGDDELLVFVPTAEATPVVGATVEARGILRPFDAANVETSEGWSDIDERTREQFASRPVLVATSLATTTGRQPARRSVTSSVLGTLRVEEQAAPRLRASESLIAVAPATLADHIASLAGQSVRVSNARVVGVFDPRVFLIESETSLRPVLGNRYRVLVFVQDGALRVAPETLVASAITVSGVARTLLGMQVTREVAWPPALTRAAVDRLEIRAAILARSVRTAEGVDLTARPVPGSAPAEAPARLP